MSKDILDITQLEEGFTELQKYSDTQFNTINKLKEDVARLQSENKSLKIMLEQNLPNLDLGFTGIGISNEQLTCETQIVMLKDLAVTRQLTLEEAKRFQIFTEILSKYKSTKKDDPFSVTKLSDEELIKAALHEPN